MNKRGQLFLIFAIAFIDVLAANGLGVLVTVYIADLPAKSVMLTIGTALMLAIQLAFSPAIGFWSDKAGRRPALISTTIASVFTTALLLPVSPYTYFTNRVLKGGTNGLYAVLRSAVADLTEGDELIRQSGILSFIISGSIILSPGVTAVVLFFSIDARFDPVYVVSFLLTMSVVNIGLALLFKETNPDTSRVTFSDVRQKAVRALNVVASWKNLGKADKQTPGFKAIFILNILGTLGFGYYGYLLAFITQSKLDMTPLETAQFFAFFGALALLANVVFFRYVVGRINKRIAIIVLVCVGIGAQIGYAFAETSITLLYVVAGIDAVAVSLLGGLIGAVLTVVIKEGGGEGEVFGNIQGLGGVASFVTALVNSLLAGVAVIAPFIFCGVMASVVLWWTLRLPDEALHYTDRIDVEETQAT